MSSIKCSNCNYFVLKISKRKKVIKTIKEANQFLTFFARNIAVNDVLCNNCRLKPYTFRQVSCESETESVAGDMSVDDDDDEIDDDELSYNRFSDDIFVRQIKQKQAGNNVEYVTLQILRTVATHKYCCVCNGNKDLIVVPLKARMQSYTKRKIFIPKGNRCCKKHIILDRFFQEDLNSIRVYSTTSTIETSDLQFMFEKLAISSEAGIIGKVADGSLSEEEMYIFTGLTWGNMRDLEKMTTSLKNSKNRNKMQAIFVFLFKLRSGSSDALISSTIGLKNKQLVSHYCQEVENSFKRDILPTRFGIKTLSRETLIQDHTTEVAKKLYDCNDRLFLICDGTYIRHQKSSNNEYQRKSYSGQKKVPLCKPFTVCTTDGFIVDMLGPYYANQNDAKIMKLVMEDPHGLRTLMRKKDIFILDRGFRDVEAFLKKEKYEVLMPALKGKRNQLTAKESNESRFVTKLRWAVEAVHGILKQKFKLIDRKVNNKLLPKIGLYCRIVSFLHNEFGQRLASDKENVDEIVGKMKARKHTENTLAADVIEQAWDRRKVPFQNISPTDLEDFPEMTDNDLKLFFTGTYQLKQAAGYLGEMINKDGSVKIQFVKERNNILKVLVPSRHINRKSYRCFIEYAPNTTGCSGIMRYTCECANGLRTIGSCSHVAAVLYYLTFARYQSKILRPAAFLCSIFDKAQIAPTVNTDSDDD